MRAPAVALILLLLIGSCTRREGAQENTSAEAPPPAATPDTLEYVARGNEPFWAVEVTPSEIVFREPENIDGVRGAYAPPAREGTRLIFRTTLRDSAATPIELTLDERPCQDSMSGFSFAYTATARVGDRVLRGCGERRPATPRGDWNVVAHVIPGISAMTDSEATKWHGRAAHYGSDFAALGSDTCRSPSYSSRLTRGDTLMAVGHGANPAAFGLKPGSEVTVFDIRCGTSPWASAGGVLLRMPDGRIYTPWDGVFFELRRNAPSQ